MDEDKVMDIIAEISKRVDNGEKSGEFKCPCCEGTIEYVYENGMAMRAKCDTCSFVMFA